MSKRTGNRKGKRGRGKYNKQYNHERGIVLAKKIMKQQQDEEFEKAPVRADPTKGFF